MSSSEVKSEPEEAERLQEDTEVKEEACSESVPAPVTSSRLFALLSAPPKPVASTPETSEANMPPSELVDLPVEAMDTEVLEAKVLRDVQQKMELRELEDKVERGSKELLKLRVTLSEATESWGKAEGEMQEADRMGERRLLRVMKERDKWRDKMDKSQERLRTLEKEVEEASEELRKRDGDGLEDGEVEEREEANEGPQDETEDQRQIRVGERTAFGKEVTSRTQVGGAKSLVSQEMRGIKREGKKKAKKKETKKRKEAKKRKIEMRDMSDSEEENPHDTDDSDWESDEEASLRKKRKKLGLDDGERENFIFRLEELEESGEMKDLFGASEELEAGLHVPKVLWDKLFNYQKVCVQWLWELHQQRVGGILGDEMGLGKTVQVIAFVAAMHLSQKKKFKEGGTKSNFGPLLVVCPATVMQQWVREFHRWWPLYRVAILHESGSHTGSKAGLIREVCAARGVIVTSYSGVQMNIEKLVEQRFEYVVLDEGHKIRNPDAQVTLAVKRFTTPHRLILSGSPMQNNLKELWSLFDFIYPGKLGTLPTFMAEFSAPITQGGYANASSVQVATAYKCATVLRDTISPYLLRRMKADVKHMINLPQKNEQVLFCKLTDEQSQLYREYIESDDIKRILHGRMKVFVGLQNLRKLCNHPDLFGFRTESYENFGATEKSGKMIVIEALLQVWKKQGHRVLLFTQSRQMLQILQRFVKSVGYSSLSMDGTTPIGSRQNLIENFNGNKDIFVFLLTTRVGGLGVNLTGASRVVIYDPDWNPSTDTQARERAWRIGQDKQVTIYRLMTAGTIEEKIYHRQIFKQFLVDRVLKDPKQRRFFKSNDLYELFTLSEAGDRGKEDGEGGTETSSIFAGTGSDVKVKKIKREKKKTELSDREKLMEKVRLISQKIGNKGKEEEPKGEKEKKDDRRRDKNTKKKFKKVDGERVPHLVKAGSYRPAAKEEEEESTGGNNGKDQDNYVLSKLFKKSGSMHSAIQHDRIVESNVSDYALVEAEAEQIANRASEALKESRRRCFRASEGVPTWTGSNGAVQGMPRIGKKVKKKQNGEDDSNDPSKVFQRGGKKETEMSASDLLQRIRDRNRFTEHESAPSTSSSQDIFFPQRSRPPNSEADEEHLEVLTDIRNFVSYQADTNGRASTREILAKFHSRLPAQQSPLFKALLGKICGFHRNFEGKGIWTLRSEFR